MPKYDYRCEDCGHEFEELQKMTDDPLAVCPKCKGSIYRVISPNVGITFKGTGFHINDYKGSGSSTTPSSSKIDKSSKGKSDTKSNKKSGDK